ncbi:MAG: FAD-dependent oxidoreductase, partial [Rhodospirillales bacterium]|nr:FAD-dependent oxidoreductase [Rhodospirillales bacterium]
MSDTRDCPVLIVGSGPAGWTAAIYAARAALAPVVIRGLQPGGQLTITTDVENYPGFAEVVQGPWLMEQMEAQARTVGVDVVDDIVSAIDLGSQPFVCTGETGTRYRGQTVVLATGASARWLGLDSEQKYRGHGVSACATCDGFFFRGKEVAVVGGGNTAVEEALFLTKFASKVTLVHRRDKLRAERILQDRLIAEPRIEIAWNSVVEEILGDADGQTVAGVRLRSTNGGAIRELAVEGVFVAIGHDPNTGLVQDQVETDADGY